MVLQVCLPTAYALWAFLSIAARRERLEPDAKVSVLATGVGLGLAAALDAVLRLEEEEEEEDAAGLEAAGAGEES